MDCFSINLNSTFKVHLSSKEHLIPPRKHITRKTESYIIYFVTSGKLTLLLNGEKIEINKGEYYIFDKYSLHSAADATDCEYFYIHFDCEMKCFEYNKEEFLDVVTIRNKSFSDYSIFDDERYTHLFAYVPRYFKIENADVFEYLVDEFKKLKLNLSNFDIEHSFAIAQGVASIFIKLERIVFDKYVFEANNYCSQIPLLVKKITKFIENNFQKNITSANFEQEFSFSYDYMNRIFKRQNGISIISYRNRLRVEKAKMLLITTDKSVNEIANEIGFNDLYYFSKFFKKSVGVSPTHYKRGEYAKVK